MRLDKFLSSQGIGSRNDVRKIIKKGLVLVNNQIIKDPEYKVNELQDEVICDGTKVVYSQFHYIIMNKSQGYVTSTKDKEPTVMELLGEYQNLDVMPIGRLDKDTEGLLLFTNNGMLSHNLTSPKKDISKKYYVETKEKVNLNYIEIFKNGVVLDDGYHTKPAVIEIIDDYHIYLTITEGKFHQVKRMLETVNNKVVYLKRIAFGPIKLDESLELGQCRKLTEEEIQQLVNIQK